MYEEYFLQVEQQQQVHGCTLYKVSDEGLYEAYFIGIRNNYSVGFVNREMVGFTNSTTIFKIILHNLQELFISDAMANQTKHNMCCQTFLLYYLYIGTVI